jgi:hypothetical protein
MAQDVGPDFKPQYHIKKSNDIHHKDRKIYPKIHMEAQRISNSQGNPEPKEQHQRDHNT